MEYPFVQFVSTVPAVTLPQWTESNLSLLTQVVRVGKEKTLELCEHSSDSQNIGVFSQLFSHKLKAILYGYYEEC